MARKQYAEAEPLLISGDNGLREREAKIPAANKPRLQKAAERLIPFYEETAQPDKAAAWKEKLAELTKPAPNAKLGVETKEKQNASRHCHHSTNLLNGGGARAVPGRRPHARLRKRAHGLKAPRAG